MGVASRVMQSMDGASLCDHNERRENRIHLRHKLWLLKLLRTHTCRHVLA